MVEITVARCSDGHLFTSTWIPFVSFRSVRLGSGRRFQKCPVDGRWRMARAVDPHALSPEEAIQASAHRAGVQ